MSIIHDALKKAEKDRSAETTKQRPAGENRLSGENPFKIEDGASGRAKAGKLQVILLVVALGSLGGLVTWRFLPKPGGTNPAVQPKTTVAPPQKTSPLAENPVSAEKLKEEALSAFDLGDFEKSRENWAKLVLVTPTDPEVYNNLGLVLKKLNRDKEAKEAYEKALGLNPTYPQALNNLGVLLMETGDRNQAKNHFEKAIRLNPSYGEAFFHLASVLENEGNKALAAKNYGKFLSLKPDIDQTLKAQVEIRIALLKAEADQGR
ncbi:MAG: tetratricopeptide repeat protein [Deltaproteobacteria bacterium]|nr:tetratricopeptide repeat protein [Deltaproteobacteria bacterium]